MLLAALCIVAASLVAQPSRSPASGRQQRVASDSSPVARAADHKAVVTTSGDIGVTFGFIRSNAVAGQPAIPFFTIWRPPSASAPWRYIAE